MTLNLCHDERITLGFMPFSIDEPDLMNDNNRQLKNQNLVYFITSITVVGRQRNSVPYNCRVRCNISDPLKVRFLLRLAPCLVLVLVENLMWIFFRISVGSRDSILCRIRSCSWWSIIIHLWRQHVERAAKETVDIQCESCPPSCIVMKSFSARENLVHFRVQQGLKQEYIIIMSQLEALAMSILIKPIRSKDTHATRFSQGKLSVFLVPLIQDSLGAAVRRCLRVMALVEDDGIHKRYSQLQNAWKCCSYWDRSLGQFMHNHRRNIRPQYIKRFQP